MSSVALVYGVGLSGEALTAALVARGWEVVIADDVATETALEVASANGVDLIVQPDEAMLAEIVRRCAVVCPAPGIPEHHRVIGAALASGTPIRSEIDLAYQWEQERPGGPRPILAVTGTDGKTTTTMLAAHLVEGSGMRCAAVGNTEVPFVAALADDVDAFVVECSSFRLRWTESFRAKASVWLNLAADHQNWHPSMDDYEAAKARLWAHRRPGDVAIGWAEDPIVMRHLERAGGEVRTFATTSADYRVEGEWLVGPTGRIAPVSSLPRRLPHDVTNALAAIALVLEGGCADVATIGRSLETFRHPPHRIEPVGCIDGVEWFNDSKATTPHASLAAIRGFDRVVLLAGGRNKGLQLSELATERDRIVGVVGLGEAAAEVTALFTPSCPTVVASSMREAVEAAHRMARPGDVVLLSPACASFDWYPAGGYPARGDDFRRLVGALAQEGAA